MIDTPPLLDHVLVPVATEADARNTATVLAPYDPDQVTVVHVVEKGGGVPDKVPLEQAKRIAESAFAAFREKFPDAADQLVYREQVVDGVVEAAENVGASAIAFQPREGSRLVRFLAGDHSLKLVTKANRPVISLPGGDR